MFASSVDQERLQRLQSSSNTQNYWHRDDRTFGQTPSRPAQTHPTEEVEDLDLESKHRSGTWGEYDVGGFNEQQAAEELEALRRNLTSISRTRSKDTDNSLRRTISRTSTFSRRQTRTTTLERPGTGRSQSVAEETLEPVETAETDIEAAAAAEEEEEFQLDQFMREGHFENRADGSSTKKVGVIYKDLTVKGTGASATFVKTLPDAILGTFGPDLYHIREYSVGDNTRAA
jgi:hypothetical protein